MGKIFWCSEIVDTITEEAKITVILPALNEEKTIGKIVQQIKKYAAEVIVVDDGSSDKTAEKALEQGARVFSHLKNKGYIAALRTGFVNAKGDIIVVMDADGQHDPADVPRLVKPLLNDEADVVIGARGRLSSFSENVITKLTRLKVDTRDACSGFRALTRDVAKRMQIRGKCTCGTFILEAHKLGARIMDVKVKNKPRRFGKSRMKKKHLIQFFLVLKELLI